MDFRDFLTLAGTLINDSTEAAWRSAVSRAYYAAFHVSGQLLRDLGFTVPHADRAHAYLWLRLTNSGHVEVARAGRDLNHLRSQRNRADYEGRHVLRQQTAASHVQTAREIVRVLDAARQDPTRTSISDAMKVYERDILKEVTWRP